MFTTEPSLSQRIERMIADCPVVDPLARVAGDETGATRLDALLAPLPLAAAGVPLGDRNPELPAQERLRRALPYLDVLRHTAIGWCFFRILRDLFDVHENRLDSTNLDAFLDRHHAATRNRGWTSQVYTRANLAVVANEATGQPVTSGAQWLDGSRLLNTGADGRPGKTDAASVEQTLAELGHRASYVVLDLPPGSEARLGTEAPLGHLLRVLRESDRPAVLLSSDRGGVPDSVLSHVLQAYPDQRFAAVTCSMDRVGSATNVDFDRRIVDQSDRLFLLGPGSSDFDAPTIEETLARRIQRVPSSRFGAFASHASTPEWIYARFQLVRKATAAALARFVADGFYEEHELPPLLRRIFHDAPRHFFGLPSSSAT